MIITFEAFKQEAERLFEKLPDEYREKALANIKNRSSYFLYYIPSSVGGALALSFDWKETPEGYDYWMNVWNQMLGI